MLTNPIIPNAQHGATIDVNHDDVHVNIYHDLTTKSSGPEVLVLAERRRQKFQSWIDPYGVRSTHGSRRFRLASSTVC